ncbi:MAG TPA: LPS assembly protein LptD [Rhizomicrobium sp.]|jgi:LPS-assembly protein
MRRGGIAIVYGLLLAVPATAATQKPANQDQMLLQADEVDYDVDRHVVRARGHVEIDYGGRIVLADAVTYDQNTDKVSADGHASVMSANGDVVFANHVDLTDHMRDGVMQGFAALIGKSGRIVGNTAQREAGVETTVYNAAYTPCKICRERGDTTPLWSVKAYRIFYDEAHHRIKFKDATLKLGGVPIFYTPYYSTPDPTVKHTTGILTPELGSSSSIGYYVKLPIYIAFSDSEDATITPFATTKGGDVLEGEYRQRWNDGGMWLQASGGLNPHGGLSGNVEQGYGHLFGSGDWQATNTWRTGYDVQLTNNDTYLKRYDISELDRLVSDLFLEGIYGQSRLGLSTYFFEGLRATDNSEVIPFALPLIQYSYIPNHKVLSGELRVDFSSVALFREQATPELPDADERITTEVNYKLPYVTDNGQLFTLQADVRSDVYHVGRFTDGNLDESRFVTRALPYVGFDWRWPFASGSGDHAFVIQPIVQAIWAPYGGNPASIPNEDTSDIEFGDQDVFSFNRLPGYDIVETGPRANVGVQADAYFPGGSVETQIGEILRPKPDPIFAADTGLGGTTSDIVGRMSIKFLPYIDLTHRVDIDGNDGSLRRNEVYLTGIFGRSTVQVSYLRVEAIPSEALPTREEVNAQATIGVFDHWELFAAGRRDLEANQMLDSEFGLGYEDECLGIALAFRERYTQDRDLPPSSAVLLRFSFKSGDQPFDPFDLFPKDIFSRP